MADNAQGGTQPAPETNAPPAAPDAATEASRLFGTGTAEGQAQDAANLPQGYIRKYWNAARGDASEYARHLSQGYAALNAEFTKATQGNAEDPRGEDAEAYFAGQTPEAWAEKYSRLDFSEPEAIRDIYRAAHDAGLGPKRAQSMVDAYLQRSHERAPEPEDDATRRSRVIHELGPQGAAMAASVATWIQGHVKGGTLTGTEVASLAPVAETADGIRALFKMSRSTLGTLPAGQGPQAAEIHRTQELEALRADMQDPKKALTPEVAARYKALVRDGFTLDGEPVPALP